ncbi:MAG: peptidoglycan DD-metalloendopeptidase family protein [Zymomonas mobilis subsp. pomaceae]|uniref:murein hydrolase activator EnvC family protein n=1 Tax=Zymomonas mobilis TaxID=542 RepID=UPI0039EBC54B
MLGIDKGLIYPIIRFLTLLWLSILLSHHGFAAVPSEKPNYSPKSFIFTKAQQQATLSRNKAKILEKDAAFIKERAQKALIEAAHVAADIEKLQTKIDIERHYLLQIDTMRRNERAELARQKQPLTRMAAALEQRSHYFSILSILKPDIMTDIVHIRGVIKALTPVIRQRSIESMNRLHTLNLLYQMRQQELDKIRQEQQLLDQKHQYFVNLAHEDQQQVDTLLSQAMYQEDKAIAVMEEAREKLRNSQNSKDLVPVCELPFVGWQLPAKGYLAPSSDQNELRIITEKGMVIMPPKAGIVLYAGNFRSYGQIVILRHENGFSSLLTGLTKLIVKTNDSVRIDQPLGYVGTGYSEIGFQIRHNDETVAMPSKNQFSHQGNSRLSCNFINEPPQENYNQKRTS